MSRFFINRPIVAMVISIVTLILGGLALVRLPVALFPNITPPNIVVKATSTGADALTVEQSVATPIEQQMSGVDQMNYMYSINANNGSMALTVSFDEKSDPNTDQVLTQMRQRQAAAQLPSDVNALGVTVRKSSSAPLLLFALYSPDSTRDAQFLANYAYININDQLVRVPGIASVTVFGAGQYAMRLWVKPDQLAKLNITISEIVRAVQQQNAAQALGQTGSEPVPPSQERTTAVRTQGRLVTAEEFGQIVVRATSDGAIVRLRDVARVELGAQVYNVKGRLNGKPSAIVAVYQTPGSNALEAAAGAKKLMAELKKRFPTGVDCVISLDTTKAVTEGIDEIVMTLAEALVLVILVVYLFLQSWRATLIPLLAVPVSLVGTFIVFPLLGFSINTLSLFGLVLAIGLVVDDAIVVVEAVEHHIEKGLSPRDATLQAMQEITGPVIGIALILSAVFVPTAFIPGITGRLYQQFAVTIAVSVLLSAFNALTLSPALCALLLRPRQKGSGRLQRFFDWFNRIFATATDRYVRISGALIRKSGVALLMLVGFVVGAGVCGAKLPTSFLPDEDQGYFFVNLQLPDAASLQRTDEVCKKIESVLMQAPGVEHVTTVVGFSLLSSVQTTYNGFFFVTLKDWSQRKQRMQQYQVIRALLNLKLIQLPEGVAFNFSPPAIPGLGASGGVTFILEDRAGRDVAFLADNVKKFVDAASKRPELAQVFTTFLPNVPQLYVDVDRDKVLKQGLSIQDVYQTIQAFLGGAFINYFNRFGRQWQVYVQADGDYRTRAESVGQFHVRNSHGDAVPLSTVTRIERRIGPEFTMRYNLYRSAQINANPAPGYSTGQAMRALEQVFARTMPAEVGFDYLGMSFQEKKAAQGVPASAIFGFSLLFVFLILAALYESWSLPFSVLLSTPIAVFGALGTLWLRRALLASFLPPFMVQIQSNVFAQIGLVMIIGLAAKNAILIVEFAKEEYEKGTPVVDAALAGARLRLRPILMTSFAFILGCVPLWIASGAGAVSRQVMGTTVIGGMLAATCIAIFFVPAAFFVVERLSNKFKAHASATATAASAATGEAP